MHAPRHLREAFAEWVCVGMDLERPIPWLLTKLKGCSDVMHPSLCEDLGMPTGSTYGQAVDRLTHGRPSSFAA
ncbi:MAG: hypothetical protein ACM3OO_01125 [Planctomycetaceae bacterium]